MMCNFENDTQRNVKSSSKRMEGIAQNFTVNGNFEWNSELSLDVNHNHTKSKFPTKNRANSRASLDSDLSLRSDWEDESNDSENGIDSVSDSNDLAVFKEHSTYTAYDLEDGSVCDELAFMLHSCLLQAEQDEIHRKIMMPQNLIRRLTKDIVELSKHELYGLRGCVVTVNLISKGKEVPIGKIECNNHVTATFEVKVTLNEDVKRWCTIKDLVLQGLLGSKEEELYLSSHFQVDKTRLYRSSVCESS